MRRRGKRNSAFGRLPWNYDSTRRWRHRKIVENLRKGLRIVAPTSWISTQQAHALFVRVWNSLYMDCGTTTLLYAHNIISFRVSRPRGTKALLSSSTTTTEAAESTSLKTSAAQEPILHGERTITPRELKGTVRGTELSTSTSSKRCMGLATGSTLTKMKRVGCARSSSGGGRTTAPQDDGRSKVLKISGALLNLSSPAKELTP
uniref:Uncharacterized protein n=1 Tax=Mycena chlorophos TaxID=658473 RepID=A0ABQ0LC57_MYCCL|nr:predicted protein [Mycena chlorophos]